MSSSISSLDDETDAKDLKPIKEYMSNRKELASQLFKSVKTEKIRMMLPQILKVLCKTISLINFSLKKVIFF
jgi:hypothetical protein